MSRHVIQGKTSDAAEVLAPIMFLVQEEDTMLITNDEQHLLASVLSMSEQCKYCSKAKARVSPHSER
jgi:hypothetical protein